MKENRLYFIQSQKDSEVERLDYMLHNMSENKAYRIARDQSGGDPDGSLLEEFRIRYQKYREGWHGNPFYAIKNRLHHEVFKEKGFPPMCVDIEVASICDLACPFCFRQWIATPDKLMSEELFYKIIDQCVELGVPSIKLNWRGEPLLHPKLPKFIDYSKRRGIIETIINTNAVTLDSKKSRALIEAGLDLLIFSFDGASKETYEKMRVGRFEINKFETVYENIRRFANIRKEMGAVFPRTKIQMILTEQTFKEKESFFNLFESCVDDVSVKAYTERGGKLSELDEQTRETFSNFLNKKGISKSVAIWRDLHGILYFSDGRLACEQPYQRMVVSYDGRVCMCCYDWGVEYPIGYVDARAFEFGDKDYEVVIQKARSGAKGFKYLLNIRMPKRYVCPPKQVQTLCEIWNGEFINYVRQMHVEGYVEEIPICKCCTFKETYHWIKMEI